MENNALVSIVIPVYNTAQYLKKCVQSVLDQTYPHFEVILVDDGSTDDSPQLCDTLAQQDARVRVLHQKNGGLSNARNSGVRAASGLSALFIDSDDWIAPTLLERLVGLQGNNPRSLCVAGIQPVLADTVVAYQAAQSPVERLSPVDACANMLYQKSFDTSACAKLVSLQIARDYPFPDGRLYEDLATVYRWVLASDEVAITQDRLYNYLQRPGSIVRQGFSPRQLDEKWAIDTIVHELETHWPSIVLAAVSRRFSCYCQLLLALGKDASSFPDVANELRMQLKKDARIVSKLKEARRKNRIAALVYRCFGAFGLRVSAWFIRAFASPTDPNFALMK